MRCGLRQRYHSAGLFWKTAHRRLVKEKLLPNALEKG